MRRSRVDALACAPVLDRLPVDRVVDVAVRVEIGRAQRPRHPRRVGRRIGQRELRRDRASAGGRAVRPEVADPGRPLIGTEVNPDAVDLDAGRPRRPAPTSGGPPRSRRRRCTRSRSRRARSCSSGAITSMRILRITQRCFGAPHPVSSPSSIAASWRKRATASSRTLPAASMSESRTRRRVTYERACVGRVRLVSSIASAELGSDRDELRDGEVDVVEGVRCRDLRVDARRSRGTTGNEKLRRRRPSPTGARRRPPDSGVPHHHRHDRSVP